MEPVDYCIVGAGIIGLAVARELLTRRPDASVTVLDKEDAVAAHQTGHNSGVVHAGIYYKAGSAKALLCRRGVGMLKEFCADHELPMTTRGKLVVARSPDEAAKLAAILDRSLAAGVPGVRIIGPAEINDLEPEVVGRAALISPTTAVVDYGAVAAALGSDIRSSGGSIVLGNEVTGIREGVSSVVITTKLGRQVLARNAVIAAGLYADRLSRASGGDDEPRILPFRGEYFTLRPDRAGLVRGLIYPVPDPRYPFLGVHFTRRVSGKVDVGPNAVLALSREGYRRRDISVRDIREMALWPGSWRLARANWRAGVDEIVGSASKRAFVRRARSFVPALRDADLEPAPSGVRAQAVCRDGSLVDDFVLSGHGRVFSVRNAPSPAATASLAIAEQITSVLLAS